MRKASKKTLNKSEKLTLRLENMLFKAAPGIMRIRGLGQK